MSYLAQSPSCPNTLDRSSFALIKCHRIANDRIRAVLAVFVTGSLFSSRLRSTTRLVHHLQSRRPLNEPPDARATEIRSYQRPISNFTNRLRRVSYCRHRGIEASLLLSKTVFSERHRRATRPALFERYVSSVVRAVLHLGHVRSAHQYYAPEHMMSDCVATQNNTAASRLRTQRIHTVLYHHG